jgi:hypothetical protein
MAENPAERIIQWLPKPPAKINREPQDSFSAHHNISQRSNPKTGPRPASSPMPSVLMGGSGLTGTLATLLGDSPPFLLCGKSKVISPLLAPCPTTSSSRIRHRNHFSAAVVALFYLPATLSLESNVHTPISTFYLYRPPAKLRCPLWWWKTTHIKATPLSLTLSPRLCPSVE